MWEYDIICTEKLSKRHQGESRMLKMIHRQHKTLKNNKKKPSTLLFALTRGYSPVGPFTPLTSVESDWWSQRTFLRGISCRERCTCKEREMQLSSRVGLLWFLECWSVDLSWLKSVFTTFGTVGLIQIWDILMNIHEYSCAADYTQTRMKDFPL